MIKGIIVNPKSIESLIFGIVPENIEGLNIENVGLNEENMYYVMKNDKKQVVVLFFHKEFYENLSSDIRHSILNILNFIYATNSMIEIDNSLNSCKNRISKIQNYIEENLDEIKTSMDFKNFYKNVKHQDK